MFVRRWSQFLREWRRSSAESWDSQGIELGKGKKSTLSIRELVKAVKGNERERGKGMWKKRCVF